MKPVDLPFFVELGGALEEASSLDPKGSLLRAFFSLYRLRNALAMLSAGDRAKLTACGHDLLELTNQLNAFEQRHFRDSKGNWSSPSEQVRSEYELNSIVAQIRQFQNVLIADLRITASFTITKSGIFDVNQLINSARQVLSTAAATSVGEDVLREIDDAGKCLAFNLPTACGFHCMRAVERVLKSYIGLFIPGEEIKKLNNWGQYISALEKHAGEEGDRAPSKEAVALMKQIKDIYRNPVIHPDRTLSSDEATTLFHSTVAAIGRVGFELAESEPQIPGLFRGLGRAIASLSNVSPAVQSDAA